MRESVGSITVFEPRWNWISVGEAFIHKRERWPIASFRMYSSSIHAKGRVKSVSLGVPLPSARLLQVGRVQEVGLMKATASRSLDTLQELHPRCLIYLQSDPVRDKDGFWSWFLSHCISSAIDLRTSRQEGTLGSDTCGRGCKRHDLVPGDSPLSTVWTMLVPALEQLR